MENQEFYVGYSKGAITPPLGIHIPGHGSVPRPSLGVKDDVYAYALAFSDGENRAILFNCDALGIYSAGGEEIRQMIAQRCGIAKESVYIACTHCHTAMFLGGKVSDSVEGCYNGHVRNILCDLAQFAMEDLKPAKMKAARGEVRGAGFIRRYKMKDGTYKTNPPYQDPNLLGPDGIQDEELQLVRILREGGKEIVLVNFGTHPDVIGGKLYSPDWPGYVVDVLKGALNGDSEVVMLNGFGGDSNTTNRFNPPPDKEKGIRYGGYENSMRIARMIAGEALKVYDAAQEIPLGPVAGYSDVATVEKNPYEEWEVPICQQIVDAKVLKEEDLPEELRKYKISLKKARRVLSNLKHEGDFIIPGYALQVGSLCFVGFPGEPFSETGLNIKKNSTMAMTFPTCRTNGSVGYFPTRRAYAGGGYERDYSPFGPNCSEELEAAAGRMIAKMKY